MKHDLDKCPCCGATPEVNYGRTHAECWTYVVCHACGLHTKNFHGQTDKETAFRAVEAWNRRAGQMALFALD